MNNINLTKDKVICNLSIDPLLIANRAIKFNEPFQDELYNLLINEFFILEKNSIDNLNTLLPIGIKINELEIKEINGNELFNSIITKQNKLNELNEEISKLYSK